MDNYPLDALRTRRAARALEQRRRRRIALAGLLIATVAAGGLIAAPSPAHSRRRHPIAASAGPGRTSARLESRAARAGSTERHAGHTTGSPAQVDAVRRLAALGLPLFCGGHERRMVALTFDDGPGVYTRLALRKLREYRLKATFFLVGKEIRAWPGLAQLEKPFAAFGDHTMTHPFLPALPQAEMVREMAGARTVIEHATGSPVLLFRPPYEGRTPGIDNEARALGLLEVLWNVDSQDSLGADYAGIERNVSAGLKPGAIVLMHENHGQTIRALRVIFFALARDHLTAVTVPQLVADDPPSPAQLRSGAGGCGVRSRSGSGS